MRVRECLVPCLRAAACGATLTGLSPTARPCLCNPSCLPHSSCAQSRHRPSLSLPPHRTAQPAPLSLPKSKAACEAPSHLQAPQRCSWPQPQTAGLVGPLSAHLIQTPLPCPERQWCPGRPDTWPWSPDGANLESGLTVNALIPKKQTLHCQPRAWAGPSASL